MIPLVAVACFRKANALQPAASAACRNLGWVLNPLRRHREASETLLVGVTLAPAEYDQRLELGKAYANLDDLKQGEVELKKAISFRPSHRPRYRVLCSVYAKMERFDLAREQLRPADALQPLEPAPLQCAAQLAQLALPQQAKTP